MKWVVAEYEYKGDPRSLRSALILSLLELSKSLSEILFFGEDGNRGLKALRCYEVYLRKEDIIRPLSPLDRYFFDSYGKSFKLNIIIKVKYTITPSVKSSKRRLRPDVLNLRIIGRGDKLTIYSTLMKGVGHTLPEDVIMALEGRVRTYLGSRNEVIRRLRIKVI
ncbi:MAG: hypothetical protein B6U69_00235 [Thermofilum sp. ex4484_15]|nr:MAG: hypothetical protein B6U69_00235 [Thermofilum sp. ex4484_15]